jgi:hypothetical protein
MASKKSKSKKSTRRSAPRARRPESVAQTAPAVAPQAEPDAVIGGVEIRGRVTSGEDIATIEHASEDAAREYAESK